MNFAKILLLYRGKNDWSRFISKTEHRYNNSSSYYRFFRQYPLINIGIPLALGDYKLYLFYVCDSFELKQQLDEMYTDFSKAFESIDHGTLIYTLNKLNVGESPVSWLNCYLYVIESKLLTSLENYPNNIRYHSRYYNISI